MHPRPIKRSRLFLLGIPGLLFLLWLWLGTRDTGAWATLKAADQRLIIGSHEGTFRIDWALGFSTTTLPSSSLSWGILKQPEAPLIAPAFHVTTVDEDHTGSRSYLSLRLAHWLIILIYLALWLTALIVWRRRQRRLHTTATASPSPPL